MWPLVRLAPATEISAIEGTDVDMRSLLGRSVSDGGRSGFDRRSIRGCDTRDGPPFGHWSGASHVDDDLPPSMSLFQMPHGIPGFAQRIRPVDDWCDLAGLNELLQELQILRVRRPKHRAQPLAHER